VVGIPLALLAVDAWWRGRDAVHRGGRALTSLALRLNLLLFLAYFAHPLPHGVPLAAIGVLWLVRPVPLDAGHRLRPPPPPTPTPLPRPPPPLWSPRGIGSSMPGRPFGHMVLYLARLDGLDGFGGWQLWLTGAVAASLVAVAGCAVVAAFRGRVASGLRGFPS